MIAKDEPLDIDVKLKDANYGLGARLMLTLNPSPLAFGTPKPYSLCVTMLSAVTPYRSISNFRTIMEMTRYNSAKARLDSW